MMSLSEFFRRVPVDLIYTKVMIAGRGVINGFDLSGRRFIIVNRENINDIVNTSDNVEIQAVSIHNGMLKITVEGQR